jgi:hypothetical protein
MRSSLFLRPGHHMFHGLYAHLRLGGIRAEVRYKRRQRVTHADKVAWSFDLPVLPSSQKFLDLNNNMRGRSLTHGRISTFCQRVCDQ